MWKRLKSILFHSSCISSQNHVPLLDQIHADLGLKLFKPVLSFLSYTGSDSLSSSPLLWIRLAGYIVESRSWMMGAAFSRPRSALCRLSTAESSGSQQIQTPSHNHPRPIFRVVFRPRNHPRPTPFRAVSMSSACGIERLRRPVEVWNRVAASPKTRAAAANDRHLVTERGVEAEREDRVPCLGCSCRRRSHVAVGLTDGDRVRRRRGVWVLGVFSPFCFLRGRGGSRRRGLRRRNDGQRRRAEEGRIRSIPGRIESRASSGGRVLGAPWPWRAPVRPGDRGKREAGRS